MDDLDRLLSSDDGVSPSARFAAGVMETIADVAAEPPPLSFPWGRFAAGVLACVAWAACGVWLVDAARLSFLSDPLVTLASVGRELEYAGATTIVSLLALRMVKIRGDS